jgi:MFS family permease
VDWRAIFLVNAPVGLFGTVWAYVALKELATTQDAKGIDWVGNLSFALGLMGVMLGLTYSISPYQHYSMGWHNPFVIISLIAGVVLLGVFVAVENIVHDPMFHMGLFRIRAFAIGNFTSLMAAIARGGLSFMLIIWLQGVWLPMHGVSFANTPLQAGIDTIPQMVGFLVFGPLSGRLSDRYGPRWFATIGMLVSAVGFVLLNTLPADFHYWTFAFYIFIVGAGMGLFASPNTSAIMSAVPPRFRGAASGMRATFMNAGMMLSMGIFFTMVISSLSTGLPTTITQGLSRFALPPVVIAHLAHLPPLDVLFAALLGYNPLKMLLSQTATGRALLAHLPAAQVATLTSPRFFPQLISHPFMDSLRVVFLFAAGMTLLSAVLSVFRGERFIYEEHGVSAGTGLRPTPPQAARGATTVPLLVALLVVWMAKDGAQPEAPIEREQLLRRALTLLALALGHSTSVAPELMPSDDTAHGSPLSEEKPVVSAHQA